MRLKVILLLFLVFRFTAFAIKVEGTIVDENTKEPIVGASVLLNSTKRGTITDIKGKFQIETDDPKTAVLKISFIGYQTKNVNLNGRTNLVITLEESVNELSEVIAVGYGTMHKSDLTGSVVSVKTSEQEQARNTSVDKMLQGKAAGLVVTTGSSAPGGAVNIRIRGTGSLRSDNSPLYVIDGNIISMDETINPLAQGTGGANTRLDAQNPLSQISPQDIESIEVLKDASATAIYGSQGANGVILITTKKGLASKPTVTVTANLTSSSLMKEIPMLNASEYVSFYNSFLTPGNPILTMDGLTPMNWQRESTRNAFSQNYRASISGKSNKTNYYFSSGYLNNQGIIKKTGIEQIDVRLNLDQEINSWLKFKSSTFYSKLNTNMTSGTNKVANSKMSIVRQMISYKPYSIANQTTTPDEWDENLSTPQAWFTDYDDNSEDAQFNTNLTLEVKPLNWLTLQIKGGYVDRNKARSIWIGTGLFQGKSNNGQAGISTLNNKNYNAEGLLLFNKKINKSNINGTLGVVYNSNDNISTSIIGQDFFSKVLRAKGISQAGTLFPYIYKESGQQLFSVLARVVYNYSNRYVITSTFRADGSSKFSPENRFSYFPSFAFAWRANQENFMKNIDQISNLKFRLGWGQVGNQAIGPYQTLSYYNNVLYANPDGTGAVGIAPGNISNPNLKWETSEQYNVGMDLGLFNQVLTLTVDAYKKTTKDLLQQIAIPISSGQSTMFVNNGSLQNRGIEITLGADVIKNKNFNLNLSGNVSFTDSKILNLGLPISGFGTLTNVRGYLGQNLGNNTNNMFPVNIFLENYAIGQFYGYASDGIMQQAEYDAQPIDQHLKYNGSDVKPGDIKLIDQNGDHIVNAADQTILGSPTPNIVYGFNVDLTYKNFGFNMMFNGVSGNKIVNGNLLEEWDVTNTVKNVRKEAYYKAWTPTNTNTTFPRIGYPTTSILIDRLLQDGTYFRMSNATLTYNFKPKRFIKVNKITLTATANNIFMLTKYNGYDPDVNSLGGDIDLMGVDLTSYPSARNFIFGLIATF